MKYEVYFLMVLCGIGLATRKLSAREWAAVGLFVFLFIMYNWRFA